MKLDWDRPGVLRATLKVDELATLVAGARLAAAALAAQSPEQAADIERVLADFDRASRHLGGASTTTGTPAATVAQEGRVVENAQHEEALDVDLGRAVARRGVR